MVVRTEVCNFSEQRIYPGKGMRVMTRDGKLVVFISRKCRALYRRKVKAQVIRWTSVWRRLNKKLKTDETHKRKKRRQVKVVRDIAGMPREEIKRKQNETKEERAAHKEVAIREIKERKARLAQQKKATKAKVPKGKTQKAK